MLAIKRSKLNCREKLWNRDGVRKQTRLGIKETGDKSISTVTNSKATLLTLLHSTVHNKTNSTATLKETVPNWSLTIINLTRKTWVLGKDGFDPERG